MEFFRVTNFDNLQHYKDRSPPWIKLYNDLLDDYNFACLQDASKLHLLMIFLLASRSENKIPLDTKWISSRISATEDIDLGALFDSGFIEKIVTESKPKKPIKKASKPLAESKQSACLEGETEGEEETEGENNIKTNFDLSAWPELPDQQTYDDWLAMRKRTKADVSQTVINGFKNELHKAHRAGMSVNSVLQECVTRNWRGFKYQWLVNQENSDAVGNKHPRQTKLSPSDEAWQQYLAESGEADDCLSAEYAEVDETAESDRPQGVQGLGIGHGRPDRH